MTIYKYPLKITDTQVIKLPFNSRILTVQSQNGGVCLWAQVEENNTDKEEHTIDIFGTGHPMDDKERNYIGTVQTNGGSLV